MVRIATILVCLFFIFWTSCTNSKKLNTTQDSLELTEETVLDIIKKANLHDPDVISTEFLHLSEVAPLYNEWPLLEYGEAPDAVKVNTPNIKILKIIENNDTVTVLFDFIDEDYPHMGWISEQDYHQKLCAMNLVVENDRWVMDDYLICYNSTIENFNIDKARSYKSDLAFTENERKERRKEVRLKYQPRLQEYKYSFDAEIIDQSTNITNEDWEARGFKSSADIVLNKLAGAQFDGIDVSDVYGKKQSSEIYDSIFRNNTIKPQEFNRSVRLNIFRHPQTGLPMLAINGQLINANRMNIYAHEGGKTVEMSFQCLTEHPVLNLEKEDAEYPHSIPHGLFVYETTDPFYWYAKYIKRIKADEEIPGYTPVEIGEPHGYSSNNLYWANKKIEELKDKKDYKWAYYQAIRKKEAIDPENNDYEKYFYVDITIYNCDQNPSISLDFDNRDFALVCTRNRPNISEINTDDIMDIEEYGFGTYVHRVVANNQHLDPFDIQGSVTASNLGLYGTSEVAREVVEIGWDTYIDNKPYGRIFETIKTANGYKFNILRNGHAYEIESIEIPDKINYRDKATITSHRQIGHLERPEY